MAAVDDGAEAQIRAAMAKAGIQPGDPLAPVLDALADAVGALSDVAARLSTRRQDADEILAAIERGVLAASHRIAGRLDRRLSARIACALVLAAAIGGGIGFGAGMWTRPGPVAVCWQTGEQRVCAPAVWMETGGAKR